jgi:hypothetical protein
VQDREEINNFGDEARRFLWVEKTVGRFQLPLDNETAASSQLVHSGEKDCRIGQTERRREACTDEITGMSPARRSRHDDSLLTHFGGPQSIAGL